MDLQTNAPLGSINVKTIVHGLIYTVGSFLVASLATMLNSSTVPTQADFISLAKVCGSIGLTYLSVNFFQNSAGNFKPESESPIKALVIPTEQVAAAPEVKAENPA